MCLVFCFSLCGKNPLGFCLCALYNEFVFGLQLSCLFIILFIVILQLDKLGQQELASRLTLNCMNAYVEPQKLSSIPVLIMDVSGWCSKWHSVDLQARFYHRYQNYSLSSFFLSFPINQVKYHECLVNS